MQAECQGDWQLKVAQLANGCGQTHGADGDLARTDAHAPRRVDGANGTHHGGGVGERLAHTHEDDVGDAPGAWLLRQAPDLFHNVPGGEIAFHAFQPGRAEFAAHWATHLA